MLYIKDGYLIDPKSKTEGYYDILVQDKKVKKIGKNLDLTFKKGDLQEEIKVIDAKGMHIGPGLVDVHVHFRDPGFTYKEDIESGSKAAARGGVTSVVLMANTKPVVDNEETLRYILEKGKESGIHVYSCATVTMGLKGETLTPMEALKKAGAVGFTDDGIPMLEEKVVRKAFEMGRQVGLPISLHEEDPQYITTNGIHQGKASEYFGIKGSSREAEISMVARDLQIALEIGNSVNIQHISTKEAVELVRQAKRQVSQQVSEQVRQHASELVRENFIHAEATPHHFSLTEEATISHGTLAKMNPPLRTEEDRMAIIEGLRDGTIDLIATDHAPHAIEEKAKPIEQAPSGIIGLETALSLGITNLVKPGYLTEMELLEKMSLNPAKLYHLEAGEINEGAIADLVIYSPEKAWIPQEYASKSSNTPFTGTKLQGVIEYTISNGDLIFERMEK